MTGGGWRWAIAGLLLAPLAARADIVLQGYQHVGRIDGTPFTPTQPITAADMRANPSRFWLTEPSTLNSVGFQNLVVSGSDFSAGAIYVDDVAVPGAASGLTYVFATPLPLPAGLHRLAFDPGCTPTAPSGCVANDVGFSAIVLGSPNTTTAVMLNQRRHAGLIADLVDGYANLYPDAGEGLSLTAGFSLPVARTLSAIQVYRYRPDSSGLGAISAALTIDGAVLPGSPTGSEPLVLATGVGLDAGGHTLGVVASALSRNFSWDDVLLFFGGSSGGVPGRFNAVDAGLSPFDGAIRTRIVGDATSVNLYALDPSGLGVLAGYTGTVQVSLLDASNDGGTLDSTSGCRSSWTPVASLGSAGFDSGNAGVVAFGFTPTQALRVARLQMTDGNGVVSCSTDAFAIRPYALSVQVSIHSAGAAGTDISLVTASADPTFGAFHRAGRPTTIRVTAVDRAGTVVAYDGSPSAQATLVPGGGDTIGSVATGSWYSPGDGTRRTDTASYSEAGFFGLTLSDDAFTVVDANDSTQAQRSLGSPTLTVGRLTPDHFLYDAAAQTHGEILEPRCGRFTYLGQPLRYATSPVLRLLAVNASGGPTLNYAGSYARLPATSSAPQQKLTAVDAANPTIAIPLEHWSAAGGIATAAPDADPAVFEAVTVDVAAVAPAQVSLTLAADLSHAAIRDQPAAPVRLALRVVVDPTDFLDRDGVPYFDAGTPTVSYPAAAAPASIPFTGSFDELRFGRLVATNAAGPETQPLVLTYGPQTAAAGGGFAPELADSGCTQAPTVSVDPAQPLPGSAGLGAPSAIVAGFGSVTLTAPGAGQTGTARLIVTPQENWLGNALPATPTVWDQPASALATFGIFNVKDSEQIDLREVFR